MKSARKPSRINGQQDIPLWAWILTGSIILIIFSVHTYGDILITSRQGLKFWDCLFSGKPLSFYLEARMELAPPYDGHMYRAAYPFPVYLCFALWGFPVWVIQRFIPGDVFYTYPVMLWFKLMLITFIILSAHRFYKIMCRLDTVKESSAVLAAFLFVTSIFVVTCAGVISQYDILNVYFMLIGLDYYLRDKKAGFFLAFVAAVSFKYFALLFFIPLLLLKNKNMGVDILASVGSIVPAALLTLIFPKPQDQIYNFNLIGLFTSCQIQLGPYSASAFMAAILAIFLWAYRQKVNEKTLSQNLAFVFISVSGSFCLLADVYPYWPIITVPFVIFSLFFSAGNIDLALAAETAMGAGLAVVYFFKYYWCYSIKTIAAMKIVPALLERKLLSVSNSVNPSSYLTVVLNKFGIASSTFETALLTISFVAWGYLLVNTYPANRETANDTHRISTWAVLIRTIINLGISLLPFLTALLHLLTSSNAVGI